MEGHHQLPPWERVWEDGGELPLDMDTLGADPSYAT